MRETTRRRSTTGNAAASRGGTGLRLRERIGGGRGSDKVTAIDPATVPLGTDDEAAGSSARQTATERWEPETVNRRAAAPTAGERPYDTTAMVIGYSASAVALALLAVVIWLL